MDANQIILLVTGITSTGILSSAATAWFNKNKLKAETQDIIGKVYGDLIEDCRAQITQQAQQLNQQAIQLNHQADQLKAMQDREVGYLKIIASQQETEKELRKQITSLEKRLSDRIKHLEQTESKS